MILYFCFVVSGLIRSLHFYFPYLWFSLLLHAISLSLALPQPALCSLLSAAPCL